jgi:hypothetical protein
VAGGPARREPGLLGVRAGAGLTRRGWAGTRDAGCARPAVPARCPFLHALRGAASSGTQPSLHPCSVPGLGPRLAPVWRSVCPQPPPPIPVGLLWINIIAPPG